MERHPVVVLLKYPLEVTLSVSVWCCHHDLPTGLGSDPPPHPLDTTQTDIDVCNLGRDIYVFRCPLTANLGKETFLQSDIDILTELFSFKTDLLVNIFRVH